MAASSTSSSISTTIIQPDIFTGPRFWDYAARGVCGAAWIWFHLQGGELPPSIEPPPSLYGRAAVAGLSATTWSWQSITSAHSSSSILS